MSVNDDQTPVKEDAPSEAFAVATSLNRELLAGLRASWAAGRPVPSRDLPPGWPGDSPGDPSAGSLLPDDFLDRTRHCADLLPEPQNEPFPAPAAPHADRSAAGPRPGTLPSADACPHLPSLGDALFGFTLRQELGRGSFARVFLAEQTDLAARSVVLKISRIEGSEPQTLAQLQHTHIVPVYSLHEDARAGLRALCMPYFGGRSLSEVLDALRQKTDFPTRGSELVAALDDVNTDRRIGLSENAKPQAATARVALGQLSYVQAAVWIVARLAEGLQHAHERGILHRDVKPSNILLGGDGQPMLLDFNLAQNDGLGKAKASLGGTVAYMSPEHLRALVSRDPMLAGSVDQRSDIYALGMVLFEMLTGRRPFDNDASYTPLPVLIQAMALERGRGSPSLRGARYDVPWSLESVMRRCLAPDPEQRYQHAEELAEDLRRFLDDQPLRYAPELSRVERVRKWARRHPRLTSSGTAGALALVMLLMAGVALAFVGSSLVDTQARWEAAHAQDTKREFAKGLAQALFLVNTTTELEDHQRRGPAVCEETLAFYGVLDRPDWQQSPDWQRLSDEDRLRQAGDVRELLLLLAIARVRQAPGDQTTLNASLALLDKAEAVPDLPPWRALYTARARFCQELRDSAAARQAADRAAAIEPQTARDYYLLAITCASARKYTDAIAYLNKSLELNPHYYWSWVQRGVCYQERHEPALAAADFGACIGLQPDFAWGYFNRADALAQCGKRPEAIADYTAALRCDPNLVIAYHNRGMLRLVAGEAAAALEDFQQALDRGRDDAALHSGRGVALERLGRYDEADAAFAKAWSHAGKIPRDARNRLRCAYGFAVFTRKPDEALAAFQAVLDDEPDNPEALYGTAMLLDRQHRATEALAYFDKAVKVSPQFPEARRFRAVLLARTGKVKQAAEEIERCLDREQGSGATVYAAACVAALTVPTDARAADRALEYLRQAFALGYGQDKAATDADLNAIHELPAFRRLLLETAP